MSFDVTANLLRRTAVVVAAFACGVLAGESQAAQIKIGTAGSGTPVTCDFSGSLSALQVDPSGNLTITCLTDPKTGAPQQGVNSFGLSAATPAVAPPGSSVSFTITRNSTANDAAVVTYSAAGGGCGSAGSTVSFASTDGAGSTKPFTVAASTSPGGSCTVSIAYNGTGMGQSQFTVDSGGGNNNGGGASCPTQLSSTQTIASNPILDKTLGLYGQNFYYRMPSGRTTAFPLPHVPSGAYSTQLAILDTVAAGRPVGTTGYLSVSKCPGLIDTDLGNRCNSAIGSGSGGLTWFGLPYGSVNTAAAFNGYGYCYAPESEGQWYLNVTWSYTRCGDGSTSCGWLIYLNNGPL